MMITAVSIGVLGSETYTIDFCGDGGCGVSSSDWDQTTNSCSCSGYWYLDVPVGTVPSSINSATLKVDLRDSNSATQSDNVCIYSSGAWTKAADSYTHVGTTTCGENPITQDTFSIYSSMFDEIISEADSNGYVRFKLCTLTQYKCQHSGCVASKDNTHRLYDSDSNVWCDNRYEFTMDYEPTFTLSEPPDTGDWTIPAEKEYNCTDEAWALAGDMYVYGSLHINQGCNLVFSGTGQKIYIYSGGRIYIDSGAAINPSQLKGWSYRRSNTISAATGAGTNYQVNVTNPVYDERDLIGSWHLDEGTGTYVYDGSNYTTRAVLSQSDHWTNDGKAGKAYDFDGTDDWLSLGTGINTHLVSSDFTLAAWIKSDAITTAYLFDNRDANDDGMRVLLDDTENIYFSINSVDAVATDHYTDTTGWHHIAVTADRDGNAIIYVDGSDVTDSPTSISGAGNINTAKSFKVSRNAYNAASYFNGKIDEIRIYKRVLSSSEIQALYDSKLKLNSDDIRFTDDDGVPLDYWKENDDLFWVEIKDDISSSAETIYAYYGNSDALNQSNGTRTWIYYDDFSYDPGISYISGSATGTQYATWDSTAGGIDVSVKRETPNNNFIAVWPFGQSINPYNKRTVVNLVVSSNPTMNIYGIYWKTGYASASAWTWNGWRQRIDSNNVGASHISFNSMNPAMSQTRNVLSSLPKWYKFVSLEDNGNTSPILFEDGTIVFAGSGATVDANTASANFAVGDDHGWSRANGCQFVGKINEVYIGKYVSPEPNEGTWGSEQAL